MSENITIGGKAFHACAETTAEQDIFMSNIIRATGAHEVKVADVDENDAAGMQKAFRDYTDEITHKVWASGKTFDLIACVLVEDGKEWTPADAKANAALLASVKDKASKEILQVHLAAVVMGFFAGARPSTTTSPKSSTPETGEVDPPTGSAEQLTLGTGQ